MVNPVCVSQGALGIARFLNAVGHVEAQDAADWAIQQMRKIESMPPGLYLGSAGIAWCLLDLGRIQEAERALEQAASHAKLFDCDDIFSGCAGFGLSCLNHWQRTGDIQALDWAKWIGQWLCDGQSEDANGVHWQGQESRKVLGYAHGSAGIAQFLLYLHRATDDPSYLDLGRSALHHDLAHGQPGYNDYMSFPRFSGDRALHPYWYVGSAGICTVLVRYAYYTGDRSLGEMLERIVPDVRRKYAMMPGLFNGLTGLANALLDIHQFMDDPQSLVKAEEIKHTIGLFGLDEAGGLAFPGEHLLRLSCDYGMGSAGIGSLLHRLETGGPNFNFLIDEFLLKPPYGTASS